MEREKICFNTKIWVWCVVLSGFVCALTATLAADEPAMEKLTDPFVRRGRINAEISGVFDGNWPDVPEAVMVYKVRYPEVTEAYVRDLAQNHFGLSAEERIIKPKSKTSFWWVKTATHALGVDPCDGSFDFGKVGSRAESSGSEQGYPSIEQCKIIAESYLRNCGLLPPDAYVRAVVDNSRGWGVISVGFGRRIGQYNNWGAGSRIVVRIESGGDVEGLFMSWPELTAYRAYPVKRPKEAFEGLRNNQGVLMEGGKGKVKRIGVRYYTAAERQEYVQPVYYFDCNGVGGRFYGMVPAIKDKYLRAQANFGARRAKAVGQRPPFVQRSLSRKMWVKCRNLLCKAEYQITRQEAADYFDRVTDPNTRITPAMICRYCGEQSVYEAVKCANCGLVFEKRYGDADFPDRCPKCGYSTMEEERKKARALREKIMQGKP